MDWLFCPILNTVMIYVISSGCGDMQKADSQFDTAVIEASAAMSRTAVVMASAKWAVCTGLTRPFASRRFSGHRAETWFCLAINHNWDDGPIDSVIFVNEN